MSYQGSKVHRLTAGLVVLGAAAGLVACGSAGGVKDGGGTPLVRTSTATFTVTGDANDPTTLAVSPNEGDAWLVAEDTTDPGKNVVTWTSSRSFAVKFVQIDDQDKKPTRKLGDEKDGWNKAKVDAAGTTYTYTLKLDKGSGQSRKTIRGAKYLVKSPDNCDASSPGTNCLVLDPVIIVRY